MENQLNGIENIGRFSFLIVKLNRHTRDACSENLVLI